VRDRFLVSLLYDTGMRIGQAIGLRHEDIRIEDQAIRIVPREDNSNGARAKTRDAYTIPASTQVLELYVRYLVDDLHVLDSDTIPDYVFVNLWDGEVGKSMTYQAVRSLFRRLSRTCGVAVMPHLLRHTRATHWIRDDALPLATVSQLLGHASIETTHATYVHLTVQDLRDALSGKGAES
jgi:integrase/recombinase XerD